MSLEHPKTPEEFCVAKTVRMLRRWSLNLNPQQMGELETMAHLCNLKDDYAAGAAAEVFASRIYIEQLHNPESNQ